MSATDVAIPSVIESVSATERDGGMDHTHPTAHASAMSDRAANRASDRIAVSAGDGAIPVGEIALARVERAVPVTAPRVCRRVVSSRSQSFALFSQN